MFVDIKKADMENMFVFVDITDYCSGLFTADHLVLLVDIKYFKLVELIFFRLRVISPHRSQRRDTSAHAQNWTPPTENVLNMLNFKASRTRCR